MMAAGSSVGYACILTLHIAIKLICVFRAQAKHSYKRIFQLKRSGIGGEDVESGRESFNIHKTH